MAIPVSSAKQTRDRIKIQVATAHHRAEYHIFQFQENKLLKALIRGIPTGIAAEDVASALKKKFPAKTVHRIKSRGQNILLMLIQAEINEVKQYFS